MYIGQSRNEVFVTGSSPSRWIEGKIGWKGWGWGGGTGFGGVRGNSQRPYLYSTAAMAQWSLSKILLGPCEFFKKCNGYVN